MPAKRLRTATGAVDIDETDDQPVRRRSAAPPGQSSSGDNSDEGIPAVAASVTRRGRLSILRNATAEGSRPHTSSPQQPSVFSSFLTFSTVDKSEKEAPQSNSAFLQLNRRFSDYVSRQMQEHPAFNWSPAMEKYVSYAHQLLSQSQEVIPAFNPSGFTIPHSDPVFDAAPTDLRSSVSSSSSSSLSLRSGALSYDPSRPLCFASMPAGAASSLSDSSGSPSSSPVPLNFGKPSVPPPTLFSFGSSASKSSTQPSFSSSAATTSPSSSQAAPPAWMDAPLFSFGAHASSSAAPTFSFSFGAQPPSSSSTTPFHFTFPSESSSTRKDSSSEEGSTFASLFPSLAPPSSSASSTASPSQNLFSFGTSSKNNSQGIQFSFAPPRIPSTSSSTSSSSTHSALSSIFSGQPPTTVPETGNNDDEEETDANIPVSKILVSDNFETEDLLTEKEASLLRLEEGKWTKVGAGVFKHAQEKDKSSSRIVFSTLVGKVLLNSRLYSNMKSDQRGKRITVFLKEMKDEKPTIVPYAISFEDEVIAASVHEKLLETIPKE